MAEAVANKDVTNDKYKVLIETNGDFTWKLIDRQSKNIYQRVIHDCDCIDIIRVRDKFEARYLDFMQNVILKQGKIVNSDAFDELACLITEVRHVIEIQGDSHFNLQLPIKMTYQHDQAYVQLKSDIKPESHPILTALGKHLLSPEELAKLQLVDKTPYEKAKGMTSDNLNAALREGKLFTRGVHKPSRLRDKVKTSGVKETFASVEVRKASRIKGKSTGTLKPNHQAKHGNPYRSTTMGGFTFSNAGFLIIDPPMSQINHISSTDFYSGCAKKTKWRSVKDVSDQEKQAQLKAIHNELKSGGVYESIFKTRYTEVLCTLTDFDAIFYNQDACLINNALQPKTTPWHKHSPYLQALYLRQEHARYRKVNLAIFYYSGNECFVKQAREYTPQEILQMWDDMIADHIKSQLASNNFDVLKQTPRQLKVACVYGPKASCDDFIPVDCLYDTAMQQAISELAARYQKQFAEEYEKNIRKKLESPSDSIFKPNMYPYLIANPGLAVEYKKTVEANLLQNLKIPEAPDDLYTLFKRSDFSDETPLKLFYALAKSCQSEEFIKKIRLLACGVLDQAFSRMNNKAKPEYQYGPAYNLRMLIDFAKDYDVSEVYQTQIITEAKAIMSEDHGYCRNNKFTRWWEAVGNLLRYLSANNHPTIISILKEPAKDLLNKHQALFRGDLDGGFNGTSLKIKDFLDTYLQLSKFCKVSKDEKKSVIISFFKKYRAVDKMSHCQIYLDTDAGNLDELKESGLLADNDIFQQIIYHLGNQQFDATFNSYYSAQRYFNNLILLAQMLSAEELGDAKIGMINSAFLKCVKNSHLQLLIDLLNNQTIDPVIGLSEELQSIIVDESATLLEDISKNKPEEFTESHCKHIASLFALIDHLEQYEIQHPGFKSILSTKNILESRLQEAGVKVNKFEVVQPLFSGKACKLKVPEVIETKLQNFTPGFWSLPKTVVCGATLKSFSQTILERLTCQS